MARRARIRCLCVPIGVLCILGYVWWGNPKLVTKSTKRYSLKQLSHLAQLHIKKTQDPEDCNAVTTIECGHHDEGCGFGCQVHCRVACLMVAVSIGAPLIHDEAVGWSYTLAWSEMLLPLGSSCSPGPNTVTVEWQGQNVWPRIYKKYCNSDSCLNETSSFRFPLTDGVPAPSFLARMVESVHPHPWLWWIGQYVKYALRLRESVRRQIEADKVLHGFPNNSFEMVGLHIRRSDKLLVGDFYHPVSEYFEAASSVRRNTKRRTAFIATDDPSALEFAKKHYSTPTWNIKTFFTNTSNANRNMPDRADQLYQIVRDVVVLGQCSHAVCAYSSNVCGLVLEIFAARFSNGYERVWSLDYAYEYVYAGPDIPNKVFMC